MAVAVAPGVALNGTDASLVLVLEHELCAAFSTVRANVAQAHFGNHALEAAARLGTGRRAAEILIEDLDPGPAQIPQPCLHRVLHFWLSKLCVTWNDEDCRTYSTALRARCCGRIFSLIARLLPEWLAEKSVTMASEQMRQQQQHLLARLCRQVRPLHSRWTRVKQAQLIG